MRNPIKNSLNSREPSIIDRILSNSNSKAALIRNRGQGRSIMLWLVGILVMGRIVIHSPLIKVKCWIYSRLRSIRGFLTRKISYCLIVTVWLSLKCLRKNALRSLINSRSIRNLSNKIKILLLIAVLIQTILQFMNQRSPQVQSSPSFLKLRWISIRNK